MHSTQPARCLLLFSLFLAAALCVCGCGGSGAGLPPVEAVDPMTLDEIEQAKTRLGEVRPGISRGEMWDQLGPILGNIRLDTVEDTGATSHATQTYRLGHGYVLRVMFDPKDDTIFRRAEIVQRQ